MNSKEIFEETGRIGNEISKLHKQLDKLNFKCLELMDSCPHEIVFKYKDNYPRKMLSDGNYFCPSCGKTIKCFSQDQLKQTVFEKSRVIPLTNLSLFGTPEVYHEIRNEVYDNYELYYDSKSNIKELSLRMEEILKDKQNIYESPEYVLKRSIRRNNKK